MKNLSNPKDHRATAFGVPVDPRIYQLRLEHLQSAADRVGAHYGWAPRVAKGEPGVMPRLEESAHA